MKKTMVIGLIIILAAVGGILAWKKMPRPLPKMDGLVLLQQNQVFDENEWQSTWPDGKSSGAEFIKLDDAIKLQGTNEKECWGCVYRMFKFNIDENNLLEIKVREVTAAAYIIFKSSQFPDGYLSLKPDILEPGVYKYDLKFLTGLSGYQEIEMQIGITTNGKTSTNKNDYAIIEYARFTHADLDITKEKITLFNKNQADYLIHFTNKWADKSPTGTFYEMDASGNLVVIGTPTDRGYGVLVSDLIIDLDLYPVLKLDIEDMSKAAYVVLGGSQFANGYMNLTESLTTKGIYELNLRKLTGLRGKQHLILQLGVSSMNDKVPAKGQWVKYNNISFTRMPPQPLKDLHSREVKAESAEQEVMPMQVTAAPPVPAFPVKPAFASSTPVLIETAGSIGFKNKYYQVEFDRKTGNLLAIRQGTSTVIEPSPNSIFNVSFLTKKEMSLKDCTFSYTKESSDRLILKWTGMCEVTAILTAGSGNYFDVKTSIVNKADEPALSLSFPATLAFRPQRVKRVLFPFRFGLEFNRNFFLLKKGARETYPTCFIDYLGISLETGDLAVYALKDRDRFQPADLSVGFESAGGGFGICGHTMPAYVKTGKEHVFPTIRFRVGQNLESTLEDYRLDCGIDKFPSLAEKIGANFDRYSGGILFKIDMGGNKDFKAVTELLDQIPEGTNLHLVTFWEGGFDRNYPDFYPPGKKYGSEADLKALVKRAHELNLIAMPYLNPTWWNESATRSKYKPEDVCIIGLDAKPNIENYNNSDGWVMCPYQKPVIENMKQVNEESKNKYGFDILFQDQLGARNWKYDLNPAAPDDGVSYIQGVIEMARESAKYLPLMTEGGFDGLLPYESGFCGMESFTWPSMSEYDNKYTAGTWRTMPIANIIGRDKVDMYHHNLAVEVFTDNDLKLTWNMLHGFHLYQGRWISNWPMQKIWFDIDDAFQKTAIKRITGKRLTGYIAITDQVQSASYEGGIEVIANFNKDDDYRAGAYQIAPEGVVAFSQNQDMLAGIFTGMFNFDFGNKVYLTSQLNGDRIDVRIPVEKNNFICVPRPAGWNNDLEISADGDVLVGRDWIGKMLEGEKQLTVQCRPVTDLSATIISAAEAIPGLEVKTALRLSNTGNDEKQLGYAFTVHQIMSSGPLPTALEPDSLTFVALKPGETKTVMLELLVPDDIDAGDLLVIRVYLKDGETRMINTVVPVVSGIKLLPVGSKSALLCGQEGIIKFKLVNRRKTSEEVKLKTTANFVTKTVEKQTVAPNSSVEIPVLCAPIAEGNFPVKLEASSAKDWTALKVPVAVYKLIKTIDIRGPQTLLAGKENRLALKLKAPTFSAAKGKFRISGPASWKIKVSQADFNLSANEEQDFEFTVIPDKGAGELTAAVELAGGSLGCKETFMVIPDKTPAILEGDFNGDGFKDVVLGNKQMEVFLTEELGGRILSLYNRATASNELYSPYPVNEKSASQTEWVEYGGINDWWPMGWPGDVWNNRWSLEINQGDNRVTMSSKSKDGLVIKRVLTLDSDKAVVKVDYMISNPTSGELTSLWIGKPGCAPGPAESAGEEDMVVVPGDKGLQTVEFKRRFKKHSFNPASNWAAAYDAKSGDYFIQVFPKDMIREIGIWEGATFFSLELITAERKLKPKEVTNFTITYAIGNDKLENLAARAKELQ